MSNKIELEFDENGYVTLLETDGEAYGYESISIGSDSEPDLPDRQDGVMIRGKPGESLTLEVDNE